MSFHLQSHLLQEFHAAVDVLVHDLVDVDEVDTLAVVGNHLLNLWAALKAFLMTEVECLGSVEELDGEDALGVLAHLVALRGGVATHADEVFLVLTAGDAVDRGGCAELLALAHDAGGGILRNHEAAVETGFGHQERRQTALGVDELVGAAFADGTEFGHGDGQEVEHHGQGLTVEVTATDDHILVGEDDGVVGGGVDFGLHDAGHIADGVLGGTVHLRGAAEAVRILHMLFVALDEFATLEVVAYGLGGLELSLVRTNHVEALVEGLDTAVEGVEREAEHQVGLLAEATGFEQRPHGKAAHKLGAVEEGEAFLALQLDGLPAFGLVDLLDVATTAFPVHVAHAEDGGEHQVGQGAKVAAGTEATLLVDHRKHVVVIAVDEALNGLQLGTAVAEAEVLRFEQQHEAHHLGGHLVAHAAGVTHHQVFLQLAELLLADADIAQRAEAGGDTVDGHLLGFHLLVEVVAAFLDAALGLVAKGEGHLFIDNLLNLVKSELFFGIESVCHNRLFFQLCFGFGGDVVVDEDTAAVFADDDFLVHLDFHLALGRDVAEAATAGVAVDGDYGQAVAGGAADALVASQVALVGAFEVLFLLFALGQQALLVFLGLGDDGGELLTFGDKVFLAVFTEQLGGFDVLLEFLDMGGAFFVFALAELYFEFLEFYLFVQRLKFAVVAHVVLLLLVFLDLLLVLGYFGITGFVGGLGVFDFGGEVVDAGAQTSYLVFQVLHGLRQFATDDLDFVNLAVDTLQGVECHQTFLDGHVDIGTQDNGGFYGLFRFFGTDFLCHFILYICYSIKCSELSSADAQKFGVQSY